MVLRPAKMNIFGANIARPFTDMPDDLLQAAELTALYFMIERSIGSRAISTRLGTFMLSASAYNFFIKRFQSAESSGMGR
tara:strand:- start:1127 stop:1366 length:240 start_codon:yes stop_codon:yes gene_type:complete